MKPEQRRTNLLRFLGDDGTPYFMQSPELNSVLNKLIASPLIDVGDLYRSRVDLRKITDNNMLTEFKQ